MSEEGSTTQESTEVPDNQEDSTLLDGGVDDSLLDGDDNPNAEEDDPVRNCVVGLYYHGIIDFINLCGNCVHYLAQTRSPSDHTQVIRAVCF